MIKDVGVMRSTMVDNMKHSTQTVLQRGFAGLPITGLSIGRVPTGENYHLFLIQNLCEISSQSSESD